MATFSDLTSDVMTITNRPDLIAETKLAVKAATLKIHQSDYYYKDLFESGLTWDVAAYTQEVELNALFPRFRSLKYVRRYDTSGSGESKEFYDILTPGELLDSYGRDRYNVAYMAGRNLNIKSYEQLSNALIGIYLNPVVTEDEYTSWIADDHPYAIVFEAARLLFKQIGYDEQAQQFERLVAEQLTLVRMTNISAVGY